MTLRLFDDAPDRFEAQAHVLSCTPREGHFAVVLDQTIFFPRGGGQPCDNGTIAGTAVLDVFEENGVILHILPSPAEGEVSLRLDGERRLEMMRHHLGQHILSAVIDHTFGVPTVIARIEDAGPHIELASPLSEQQLVQAQQAAREIIGKALAVHCAYYTPEQAKGMTVRGKITPHEHIRLVEIEGFDLNACGGTHCSDTSGVLELVITGTKMVRGAFRVYYLAGHAAQKARPEREGQLLQAQHALGCESASGLLQAQQELLERQSALEAQCQALQKALLEADTALWAARCRPLAQGRMACAILDEGDVKHLRAVAEALCQQAPTALLLAVRQQDKLSLLFMRSKGPKEPNLGAMVKDLCARFDGRGGGSPISAQGVICGGADGENALQQVFRAAEQAWEQPKAQ